MKGKLICIEGLDGSGKSTQIKMLAKYFSTNKIKSKFFHFPRFQAPIFGQLISNFLKGNYGGINEVDPYLVALLYAGDRLLAKNEINRLISQKSLVIIDRYVYSNIAFQCAKIEQKVAKDKLKKWLLNLEYKYFEIPRPSLSIFLKTPFSFVKNGLNSKRIGSDREYLKGMTDIHEESDILQRSVAKEYEKLILGNKDFVSIKCYNTRGAVLPPHTIHKLILNKLKDKRII